MNFSEGRQGGCGRTPLNPPLKSMYLTNDARNKKSNKLGTSMAKDALAKMNNRFNKTAQQF